jgi:ribonuclease J
MTSITVLAGERTIGGTQIVVEDGGARLIFDCGLSYDPAGDPFSQVLRRPGRVLADLIALGLAPAVPGLYATRWLESLPDSNRPAATNGGKPLAVALSHSHLDHAQLAGFVEPAVPVYCASATARIVEALGALGSSLAPSGRRFTETTPDDAFTVGPMRARLLPVDHDVCGASGLLIETTSGTIAYSGDLRLHGAAPERSLAFARATRAAGARLLILEGTRLRPMEPQAGMPSAAFERGETEVAPLVAQTLREARDAIGVILLTPENGERVEALARAMQDIGRLLVLDVHGLVLATAALGRGLAVPHAVYVPSGLARRFEQQEDDVALTRLRAAIAAAPAQVTSRDIAADPGHFLLRLDWPYLADLLDVVPPGAGGVAIHADGLPLGPFDPAWRQLLWWVERLGLRLVPAGSSGHAVPADLTAVARESGAPVVMAVHSLYPELLQTGGARLLLPERGRAYEVDRLTDA